MSNRASKKGKPNKPPGKSPAQYAKTRTWSLPTVLSLVLGAVGAVGVIELRPQMNVSPQEPIEKSQPFSVPFRIDNTGYFSFNVADIFCYVGEVKVGASRFKSNSIHYSEWDNVNLERGDGGTVTCNIFHGPIVQTADIAIVIDYKPFRRVSIGPFRKYFHFKGAYVDNWQWIRSPSAEIEADADRQIASHVERPRVKHPN